MHHSESKQVESICRRGRVELHGNVFNNSTYLNQYTILQYERPAAVGGRAWSGRHPPGKYYYSIYVIGSREETVLGGRQDVIGPAFFEIGSFDISQPARTEPRGHVSLSVGPTNTAPYMP